MTSACDPGIKSSTKFIDWDNGNLYQHCHISIKISNNVPLVNFITTPLNCMTWTSSCLQSCTAVCFRSQGWDISDTWIQAGLEDIQLAGRSQFLAVEESSVLGLDGASTVLNGGG